MQQATRRLTTVSLVVKIALAEDFPQAEPYLPQVPSFDPLVPAIFHLFLLDRTTWFEK